MTFTQHISDLEDEAMTICVEHLKTRGCVSMDASIADVEFWLDQNTTGCDDCPAKNSCPLK